MPYVLWKLTECSFRYDLLALGRVLVPRRSDPAYGAEREELLANIFEDKCARAPSSIPQGPAHGDIRRRPFRVETLWRVIICWSLIGRLLPFTEITLAAPIENVAAIEKDLTGAYVVNTFFAYHHICRK